MFKYINVMKYLYILIFIFISNCSGNKVSNYHGTNKLENKFNKIKINKTNKNDLLRIIGPPSSKSDFNQNIWYYIERLKSNQSLFKLGTQKIKKNNILIVELDDAGLLKNKTLLDLNNMNDIKYLKNTTKKEYENDSFLYDVFSTLREKINSPIRKTKK